LHGPLVEGLYVLQDDVEVQAFCVDLFVDEGVEDKGVIRAGAKSKGKSHEEFFIV